MNNLSIKKMLITALIAGCFLTACSGNKNDKKKSVDTFTKTENQTTHRDALNKTVQENDQKQLDTAQEKSTRIQDSLRQIKEHGHVH